MEKRDLQKQPPVGKLSCGAASSHVKRPLLRGNVTVAPRTGNAVVDEALKNIRAVLSRVQPVQLSASSCAARPHSPRPERRRTVQCPICHEDVVLDDATKDSEPYEHGCLASVAEFVQGA